MQQCVERYCELAKVDQQYIKRRQTPCIEDHQLNPEDFVNKGALAADAARIVFKCFFGAGIVRCDILRSVNDLARNVTKWIAVCDKRFYKLICYINSN